MGETVTPEHAYTTLCRVLLNRGRYNPGGETGPYEDTAYRLGIQTPDYGRAHVHTYGLESFLGIRNEAIRNLKLLHRKHLMAATGLISVHFDHELTRDGNERSVTKHYRLFRPGAIGTAEPYNYRDSLLPAVNDFDPSTVLISLTHHTSEVQATRSSRERNEKVVERLVDTIADFPDLLEAVHEAEDMHMIQ